MGGQHDAPVALPREKRPGTDCSEGCMGLGDGMDTFQKFRPSPEFAPRTVQPAGSHYTDYAFLAHSSNNQIHDDVNLNSKMFRIRICIYSLCEFVTTQMQSVLNILHIILKLPRLKNSPFKGPQSSSHFVRYSSRNKMIAERVYSPHKSVSLASHSNTDS